MRLNWGGSTAVWQDLVRSLPCATFFHTPAWAALYEAAGYGHVEVLQADWPDGRQAVLPVAVQKTWRGLSRRASSAIDCGYGGVLAGSPLDPAEASQLYRAVRRRFPETCFISNPFDPASHDSVGMPWQRWTPTRVIHLAPLEALREAYHTDRRRALRRYERSGVQTTVVARPGPDELRRFLDLYHHEVAHWDGRERVRPDGWFRQLWQMAGDSLRLVVATVDGEVAGMELHVRQGRIATGLFLVWERRFRHCQIPTALVEGCLRDTWELGCEYLDMMTCGHNDGVDAFKASFGATALPLTAAHQMGFGVRGLMLAQAVSRRVRRLWRAPMPSPGARPAEAGSECYTEPVVA